MKHCKILIVVSMAFFALAIVFPTPSNTAQTLTVTLDKPKAEVRQINGVKVSGKIDGLQYGKRYIIRIQVYEDGGSGYSAPHFKSFDVKKTGKGQVVSVKPYNLGRMP